ncbi:unnamed protein product [Rangifer tarandus platyrhynchus]|uniref:Uncharacterized protein n=1 Tax=Rangifer tarandus platyrhynchus TaxID=3082113 RepID=A0ABN8Y1N2_RANTA|nr:unnamed protein product [Rangifer tarandus platyrhynchus]
MERRRGQEKELSASSTRQKPLCTGVKGARYHPQSAQPQISGSLNCNKEFLPILTTLLLVHWTLSSLHSCGLCKQFVPIYPQLGQPLAPEDARPKGQLGSGFFLSASRSAWFSPSGAGFRVGSPSDQPPAPPPSAGPSLLARWAPGRCCPGLFLAPERRPARRQVTCVSDSLSQGGPGARAPPIGGAGPGPALGRGVRAGGPDGRPQRRISCSEAAQQQKERNAPAAASGAASGGLERPRAPRPAVRVPQLPQPPACGSPPAAFAARPAAGRAHVSAGGAGVQGRSLRVAPRAAVGALPQPRSPLAAAGRLPTASAAPEVRAGAGRRLGVWFLPPPTASAACSLGAAAGPTSSSLSSSLGLLPSAVGLGLPAREWASGAPCPGGASAAAAAAPGRSPPGLAAARAALPARGGSATPRPALARPSLQRTSPKESLRSWAEAKVKSSSDLG